MASIRDITMLGRAAAVDRDRLNSTPLKLRAAESEPLVSVVIPCHNYGRYLADCVRTVTTQKVNVEVIIVDDASTDDSFEQAMALQRLDPRISVLRHTLNRGHIATYNHGLETARGKYLVLLSADDALAPDSLADAVALLEHDDSIGFVYGRVEAFTDDIPESPRKIASYKRWHGHEWLARRCRRVTNCIYSPEVVMRRSIYEQVGPYDPELPHTGDLAMWMGAALISNVGYVQGPPSAFYRMHGQNMHKSVFESGTVNGMLIDLEQRRLTFEKTLAVPDSSPALNAQLLQTAMRRLSSEALEAAGRAFTWGLVDVWPVDQLVDFAAGTWPNYRELPAWRALRRRQLVGKKLSHRNPMFVAKEITNGWKQTRISTMEKRTGA